MTQWSEWAEEFIGESGTPWPRSASSTELASSIVVKSGPARLWGFTVYNSNAAAQFILVFDANSLPADGATADIVFTVAASSHLPINYIPGRAMLRGLVMCNSSTEPTKTIGSADCFFDVQYV